MTQQRRNVLDQFLGDIGLSADIGQIVLWNGGKVWGGAVDTGGTLPPPAGE